MFGALFKPVKRPEFDESNDLSGNLEVVWKDGKCGIYDSSSGLLVLAIEYTEISLHVFPYCRIVKTTGEIGNFNIFSHEVNWTSKGADN